MDEWYLRDLIGSGGTRDEVLGYLTVWRAAAMGSSERILIVDDEESVCNVLVKFVARQGFRPDSAFSGDEALALLERNDYDFVITDLMMPGTDGLELLQRVKAMKVDVPVAIITGFGTLDLAIEAIRNGAVDFIKKPFDFGRITQLISKVFERRKHDVSYQEALAVLTSGTFQLPNDVVVLESAARIATKRLEGTPFYDGVYLALIESLTNAMEHGNLEISQDEKLEASSKGRFDEVRQSRLADHALNARKIFLKTEISDHAICFTVRDEGKGFDYNSLPDPTQPENIFNASGRGVLLIQCYMDEVSWNEAGNEVRLLKKLSKPLSG